MDHEVRVAGLVEETLEDDVLGRRQTTERRACAGQILDELLGRGTCPSTGESARRTSAVMDAVLADYYGGRNDAFWERSASWPGRS